MAGGVLSGTVSSIAGGAPISSAHVAADHDPLHYSATSSPAGLYRLDVLSGTYTVSVSAFGYLPFALGHVGLPSGITTTLPITLTPAHMYFFPIVAR